jgi:hypothetical protein
MPRSEEVQEMTPRSGEVQEADDEARGSANATDEETGECKNASEYTELVYKGPGVGRSATGRVGYDDHLIEPTRTP